MTTVAVSAIRTNARRLADMENSNFVSPEEWITYIDKGYKRLYDILTGKFEDWYTDTPTAFSVASGSYTYSLPSNFYKLRGVDRDVGGGRYIGIGTFTFEERNRDSFGATYRGTYRAVRYRLLKDKLMFSPQEQAPGDYRLWYIPTATTITSAADLIQGVNGWEEYIEFEAAIMALIKEESDTTVLERSRDAIIIRINEMAQNRDIGMTQRITDVSGYNYYDEDLY